MKTKYIKFLLFSISTIQMKAFQVEYDGLLYNLDGATASLAFNIKDGIGECLYRNETYTIPSKIYFEGLDYTVVEIGRYAFSGWSGESSPASTIKLPDTIERIGECAFRNCVNLTSIIIPASTKQFVNENPFEGCSRLREIIYLTPTPPGGWWATSFTYVTNKELYTWTNHTMGNAQIIQMLTFDNNEFIYDGRTPFPNWKNNMEGYEALPDFSGLKKDVGQHTDTIPVTFTKNDESFIANIPYKYTIKPAKLTVMVSDVTREYGEENPEFNITYSGLIDGQNDIFMTTQPTVLTTATKTSPVGEYPIKISGGSSKNYEIVYKSGILTITKAPLSAKVKDVTKVYGSAVPTFSIEFSGLKNDETTPAWTTSPVFKTEATQNSSVGLYVIKAIGGDPRNYDMDSIYDGTMNVTPASLTIQAKDVIRQYYTDNPQFKYTCAGFVNGDDESVLEEKPILNTSASLKSDVGEYDISVSGAKSNNYDISFVNGKLSITPRVLSVSVGKYEKIYGEENPEFNVVYEGFVGDDNESIFQNMVKVETTATKESDVGTYPITIFGDSAINYTIFYTPGSLTINKAEQTIVWEQELDSLHVGDQVELNAQASSGLPITYTLTPDDYVEKYQAGSKTFIDCIASGKLQIRAVQEGNKNFYSSPRVSKNISVIDSDTNPNPNPNFLKGDVNGDDKVDIADVVAVINIMAGL